MTTARRPSRRSWPRWLPASPVPTRPTATARGVDIDGIDVELEGKVDLNGFLLLAQSVPVRR